MSFSTAELDERLVLGENEDIAHFAQALVGRAHVVGALDLSTHAYGRTSFVHDGRPQSIEMRAALEIRGRVVEEQSRKPLRRVYLLFEGLGSPGWLLEAQQLELDAQGGFSLRAPGRVPVDESMQLDPPERWTLSAEQPGYDARQFLSFERGGAPILDVGEITLVRHKNPIALAAGHGLKVAELDGQGVVFADKPAELWKTIAGVALEDGRLEIEFSSSPVPSATPHGTRVNLLDGEEQYVPFDRPLGTILFVSVVDDVRSFRLESDGLYHLLPEDSLELTLRTETTAPEDKPWRIGWSWDGAWIEVGQLAPREPGTEAKARITVPHGAQQLWWSSSGIPPELHGDPGGFQAITGSSMKVVLR